MTDKPNIPSLHHNCVFSVLGGLSGALALAAYAAASHGAMPNLNIIAPILMAHAPTFLVISLLGISCRSALFSGTAIFIGLLLFCGDLLSRDITGERLFPFAAPTGGTILILGWLSLAFCGLSRMITHDTTRK